MAYLIVCCDGTWNDPDNRDGDVLSPTNVKQFFDFIPEIPDTQYTRYQAGVGTDGGLDKITGGIFGFGISEDIRDCYQWIADKYKPGDKIVLTGFSRGAYTARSLAGIICQLGIVDLHRHSESDWDEIIKTIYKEGYRNKESAIFLRAHHDIEFLPHSDKVFFLGVWDTVGALGIPDDKAIANLFDNPKKYQFHDVKLSHNVAHARHAVAIDEQRGSFTPTLWKDDVADPHPSMSQLWFPGVHSDIGGGYKEDGLSNIALIWMIDELQKVATDLQWHSNMIAQVIPNPADELHNSHVGMMKVLVTAPRNIPCFAQQAASFHESALSRRENPPRKQGSYRTTRPISPGSPVTLDIYAKHPWSWTGIYLEEGKSYRFTARGQWVDKNISCGPAGTNDGKFYFGELAHLASEALGVLEKAYKRLLDKPDANFMLTKRNEDAPYFCLMGAIANGGNPNTDGTHSPLREFSIGAGTTITVKKSGYLYCFPNDAWGFYGNNRGYVTLKVEEY
ncbi:DUF2235 domain-containing protein [Photobacterium sp. DA100]|uniref:DUF2235 domain-containing protein n=1 Tax=Photobacterium sp. DA100 TaxID=3027472 RepID=UPI002478B20C|nr:DUF2235 domain-containing protein [Photobacterium sp. DA100]WEM43816.1 DUF2235 domain-containing protein [Photobacterium sp. DA100]